MSDGAKIRALADELQRDPVKKANNIVKLLAAIDASASEPAARAAIQCLKLFFLNAFESGDLDAKRIKLASNGTQQQASSEQQAAAEDVFKQWLARHYSSYQSQLLQLLVDSKHATVQVAAAASLMELVRAEVVGIFNNLLFVKLLTTVLTNASVKPEVCAFMFAKYLPFADVRYYALRCAAYLARRHAVLGAAAAAAAGKEQEEDAEVAGAAAGQLPAEDLARNLFDLLSQAPPSITADPSELTSWCGAAEVGAVAPAADAAASAKARRKRKREASAAGGAAAQVAAWANAKVQKRAFSDAWMAFLQMALPQDIYKKVLIKVHSVVIPHMLDPLLLADFLTHSIGQGGLLGVLALNGLFVLVTKHGLEYPKFYQRLYNLLQPEALAAKHRAQFFQLVDIFLASGLVPAYTVAAFAKRFARLALGSSPAGAMLAVAFVHNLVRRHPSLMVLLHRPVKQQEEQQQQQQQVGEDVYDELQEDPGRSRAVESSLWEVTALKEHYCPQVASFVSVLDKDLGDRAKTSEVDLQPLLGLTYGGMFKAEAERRIKAVPLAHYQQAPSKLFDVNCAAEFPGWTL